MEPDVSQAARSMIGTGAHALTWAFVFSSPFFSNPEKHFTPRYCECKPNKYNDLTSLLDVPRLTIVVI